MRPSVTIVFLAIDFFTNNLMMQCRDILSRPPPLPRWLRRRQLLLAEHHLDREGDQGGGAEGVEQCSVSGDVRD